HGTDVRHRRRQPTGPSLHDHCHATHDHFDFAHATTRNDLQSSVSLVVACAKMPAAGAHPVAAGHMTRTDGPQSLINPTFHVVRESTVLICPGLFHHCAWK